VVEKLYLSHGLGVNSWAAYLLLIERGLVPGVDFEAVAVDHGTDWPETYEYLAMMLQRGYPVTVLKPNIGGCNTLYDYCMKYRFIPGRQKRWCTSRFKVALLIKYYQKPCTEIIAFEAGEERRVHRYRHKNDITAQFLLIDEGITRQDCVEIIKRHGLPVPMKSGCYICFAGETEVITPGGVKPISQLVGKATLLIPREKTSYGDWMECEVKSFEIQPLMKLTLRRYRALKEIYVTANHRWVTKKKNNCYAPFVTTRQLQPGDIIPSCRATSILASRKAVEISPIGVAHGFAFGDGTFEKNSKRPMSLTLFGDKDKALLPYFSMFSYRDSIANGKTPVIYVYGLPRYWKKYPPLDEHRGYLLGWLAGYFAADGHVSKEGQANIYSSNLNHIKFVRDACYLLGVQTSPIITKEHPGIHGILATLHSTNLYTRDLPITFWLNTHHRERIQERHLTEPRMRQEWIVQSVEFTERVEEVFCAIVPGREMFTLSDGVITGNCPFQRREYWILLKQRHPDLFQRAVDLERACGERQTAKGKNPLYYKDRPLELIVQLKDGKGRLAIAGTQELWQEVR